MRFYPVILCGGSGTRLWPASRNDRPKQFIPLLGERSLFQDTVLRLAGLDGAQPPLIVTGAAHAGQVTRQLDEIGLDASILVEPEGRDSAAAIAAASAWVMDRDPDGVIVALASDHHVPDAAAFRAAVERAGVAAGRGSIVTFGVEPTEPATAYGYIQPGDMLVGAPGVHALKRFVEKPDLETAKAYLGEGYLWNSGNFIYRAATMAAALERHAPAVLAAARQGLAEAETTDRLYRLGPGFVAAPKISIDYAVMEKTDSAAVAPVSFAWSDVGAWEAVRAAMPTDGAGNAVAGDAVMIDSTGSLVRSGPGAPLVVGVGLKGVGVLVEADAILVCDLSASQGVKLAVDRLKAGGRSELKFGAAAGDLAAARDRFERWTTLSALPLWWTVGADHATGGFHESLDHQGRPVMAPRRARVQVRQVFVYATAGLLGWTGPWEEAASRGMDFFLAQHTRPDGLFRTQLNPDGSPADETAVLYDQAFSLLAMATLAQAAPARRGGLQPAAERLLATLRADRSHPAGGFTELGAVTPFQANPHMHLFEAALAWCDVGGGEVWERLADEVAELALSHFIDSQGALHEAFDEAWRPAAGLPGRIIEPGHQFEWAWLLERWSRRRGRADAHAAARRLFEVGSLGVDPARGVAMSEMLDDLTTIKDPVARLWQQTEWLKAALILAEAETDPRARRGQVAAAESAVQALFRYFDPAAPGLYHDKLEPDGRFRDEPVPASSLYHIVCAFKELKERLPA